MVLAGEGKRPIPQPYPFEAYALVAMPDRFADVTRRFGEEQGLTPPALRAFERRLEHLAHRRILDFTGTNLLAATGRPTLLLHARDDQEVPFADAEAMAEQTSHAELQAFDGFGHRMVLVRPACRPGRRGVSGEALLTVGSLDSRAAGQSRNAS